MWAESSVIAFIILQEYFLQNGCQKYWNHHVHTRNLQYGVGRTSICTTVIVLYSYEYMSVNKLLSKQGNFTFHRLLNLRNKISSSKPILPSEFTFNQKVIMINHEVNKTSRIRIFLLVSYIEKCHEATASISRWIFQHLVYQKIHQIA